MATSYSIGKHFEDMIAGLIKDGRYATGSEIIREGLRLIEEREERRKASSKRCGLKSRRGSIAVRHRKSVICSSGSRRKGVSVWRPRMPNRARKSPQTETDVTSIWNYIAADSIKAADALVDRIERTFDMLAEQPLAGRARGDLVANLRSFPLGKLRDLLPVSDGVEVVRIMSGRQDIDAPDDVI